MARPKSAGETAQTALRLPVEMFRRIDAHVERMRTASPGVTITRTDAVRSLLHEALERRERSTHK